MGEHRLAHAAKPCRGSDIVERDLAVSLHRADPGDPDAVDVNVTAGHGDRPAGRLGRLIGQPIGALRLVGAVIGEAQFGVEALRTALMASASLGIPSRISIAAMVSQSFCFWGLS